MIDDAGHCRQIVRTKARTFWLASRFLPSDKRRAAFAVYAFCREADDIVDAGIGTAASDSARTFPEYRSLLTAALSGTAHTPVLRELALAVRSFGVPHGVLEELLGGVARDCSPHTYESWDDLEEYCQGVASSVGEMCTYIFGVAGDATMFAPALGYARTLGVAMQLTNVLRDVGEDARAGRCYLPVSELAAFDISRQEVMRQHLGGDARWHAFMRFQIARARGLYTGAMPGIALLSADSRQCAAACAVGYAGILDAIEAIGYDTFASRAQVGPVARMAVLWRVWRANGAPGSWPPPSAVVTAEPATELARWA